MRCATISSTDSAMVNTTATEPRSTGLIQTQVLQFGTGTRVCADLLVLIQPSYQSCYASSTTNDNATIRHVTDQHPHLLTSSSSSSSSSSRAGSLRPPTTPASPTTSATPIPRWTIDPHFPPTALVMSPYNSELQLYPPWVRAKDKAAAPSSRRLAASLPSLGSSSRGSSTPPLPRCLQQWHCMARQ